MAEAAAVIGLVSSIITFVDLGAKIVSRIRDFTDKSSEVPESFRALADRLPLLIQTLKRIQVRAEAGNVSKDVATDLETLVASVNVHVESLEQCLRKIAPSVDASRLKKAIKGLQSLTKDEQMEQTVEKIHKGLDVLVLHQTTANIDLSDRILQRMDSLTLESSHAQPTFGLWLDQAPRINPNAFLGRTVELQQLDDWLSPKSNTESQKVASIVGMGGLGKTQLSLAYTRQHGSQYSSVFWLNAEDKLSVQQSLLTLSYTIFANEGEDKNDTNDEDLRIQKVRRWLSEPWNNRWLIVFDNYDDPALPNVPSSTGFDIRAFFPLRIQGSILITTRSPKLTFSQRLVLQKLEDISLGVAILSQRAERDLSHETTAQQLAVRLDGLPLALATAGTYIGETGVSCAEYLDMYEELWSELHGSESEVLLEYTDRTLSSTWMLSLDQVNRQDADAVELLKFFALLNNEDIWYELLQAGASGGPPWLGRVTSTKLRFDRTMSKLRDYSLVEMVPGSYRVHPCIHDWLLEQFQLAPDQSWFLAASNCVASNIVDEEIPRYWSVIRRLIRHIRRLNHKRFEPLWEACSSEFAILDMSHSFGRTCLALDQFREAERLLLRALGMKERALELEHTSTLDTVNWLGNLYLRQGKLVEAGKMYTRAILGREQVHGPEHIVTLRTVNNLGLLYADQGKLVEAEQMLTRAIAGYEQALGPKHTSTLDTVNNLGFICAHQGKLVEAEQMYTRALAGFEQALGPDNISTLRTVYNFGLLYADQGKLEEAEQMYRRALSGYEQALGPESTSTLRTMNKLGLLYAGQGKLEEAEQMYKRSLAGYEKVVGSNHISAGIAINNLDIFYCRQGRWDEAKNIRKRYPGVEYSYHMPEDVET